RSSAPARRSSDVAATQRPSARSAVRNCNCRKVGIEEAGSRSSIDTPYSYARAHRDDANGRKAERSSTARVSQPSPARRDPPPHRARSSAPPGRGEGGASFFSRSSRGARTHDRRELQRHTHNECRTGADFTGDANVTAECRRHTLHDGEAEAHAAL